MPESRVMQFELPMPTIRKTPHDLAKVFLAYQSEQKDFGRIISLAQAASEVTRHYPHLMRKAQ